MDNIQFIKDFSSEFRFSASRSSGPGGQNVNKVNSKVELRFNVVQSDILSEEEKVIVYRHLKNKINNDDELVITVQSDRSQLKNKKEAIEKFNQLIVNALTPRKKRKSTSPTRTSVEKRLKQKKEEGEKKQLRKRIDKV